MLEIRAIEVIDNATGDAPILPCLLDQIPTGGTVASISGDDAYDNQRLLRSDCATWGGGDYPHVQERQAVKGQASWRQSLQRYPASYAPAWQENLEEVEQLSSAQPCRDQDALLQAAW
jgi:hypothetical protein